MMLGATGRLPDLMGCPPVQNPPRRARCSPTTLQVAERLWNLKDSDLAKVGDRLIDCATSECGYRCQIPSLCPRCGRRAAIRERRETEQAYGSTTSGSLVTRTVSATSIAMGHRIFLHARRAQSRSTAWRATFICGRGRIEVVPSADGRWLVHGHEQCLRRHDAVPVMTLRDAWKRYLGPEGLAGNLHIQTIERSHHRRGAYFDPVSFYTTKRKRSELLEFTDDALREWARVVPRQRWALRFGRPPSDGRVWELP